MQQKLTYGQLQRSYIIYQAYEHLIAWPGALEKMLPADKLRKVKAAISIHHQPKSN